MLKAKQCWNVVSGTKVTCLTCTPGWKVFALRIFLWVLASLMWVMRYAQLALIILLSQVYLVLHNMVPYVGACKHRGHTTGMAIAYTMHGFLKQCRAHQSHWLEAPQSPLHQAPLALEILLGVKASISVSSTPILPYMSWVYAIVNGT